MLIYYGLSTKPCHVWLFLIKTNDYIRRFTEFYFCFMASGAVMATAWKYCLCSVDKSPVCRCIFRKYIDMVKSSNIGVESRMNFHVDFCICLPQPEPHRPKHNQTCYSSVYRYEFPFVFRAASHIFIADCFGIIKNSFRFARCQIRVRIFMCLFRRIIAWFTLCVLLFFFFQ